MHILARLCHSSESIILSLPEFFSATNAVKGNRVDNGRPASFADRPEQGATTRTINILIIADCAASVASFQMFIFMVGVRGMFHVGNWLLENACESVLPIM